MTPDSRYAGLEHLEKDRIDDNRPATAERADENWPAIGCTPGDVDERASGHVRQVIVSTWSVVDRVTTATAHAAL